MTAGFRGGVVKVIDLSTALDATRDQKVTRFFVTVQGWRCGRNRAGHTSVWARHSARLVAGAVPLLMDRGGLSAWGGRLQTGATMYRILFRACALVRAAAVFLCTASLGPLVPVPA